MSSWRYYHRFDKFIHEPKKGETLREFVETDCYRRARLIQEGIETTKPHLIDVDYDLVKSMPVNFCVYISNYSVKKHGFDAPPIVADRLGKYVTDEEYSFYGTFGDFLIHISATQYDWIGELEYPDWEIYPPDLIAYDHYDYSGGDLDEEDEE